jgi:hypothetical protein
LALPKILIDASLYTKFLNLFEPEDRLVMFYDDEILFYKVITTPEVANDLATLTDFYYEKTRISNTFPHPTQVPAILNK